MGEQLYSLSKRTKNGKAYWYVQFKDSSTCKYGTAKSVDSLNKKLGHGPNHISKKWDAEVIAREAIATGLSGSPNQKDSLFIEYLRQFWDFDNSDYIKRKNARANKSINESEKNPQYNYGINRDYVSNLLGCVNKHVAPNLPEGLRCSQVRQKHIMAIQDRIDSVYVWQLTLKCLRPPIKQLLREEILLQDPLLNLNDDFPKIIGSSVGSLTEDETNKLINQMYRDAYDGYTISAQKKESDESFIGKETLVFLDKRIYLAVCLAASTGMRRGEILGLHTSDIIFPDVKEYERKQAVIIIRNAFAVRQGMKSPKSRKERVVFIDKWLADALLEFAKSNSHNNGLVFYSDKNPDNPLFPTVITKWFNRELARIGISEEERKRRHLVFHSLRHYANSEMRTLIGDERTQLIMGHTSTAMTNLYDTADKTMRALKIGQEVGSLIINPNEINDDKGN